MHDGETLKLGAFELRVIRTPGHSPGHACFYMERELLLLSGDHVLPTISPNVGLWPGSDADPLGDYIRSFKLLRGLPVKHVYPAHEYDFADLEARLDELEVHHEERLGEVIAAMTAGATTCYEIARGVKWSIGHFDKFDFGTSARPCPRRYRTCVTSTAKGASRCVKWTTSTAGRRPAAASRTRRSNLNLRKSPLDEASPAQIECVPTGIARAGRGFPLKRR